MIKWLIILNPESDFDDYKLVIDIASGCVELCKTVTDVFSTLKIRDLLLHIFNLLRISYKKGDLFQGFRNLLIMTELVNIIILH